MRSIGIHKKVDRAKLPFIFADYADGMSLNELAEEYGYHKATLHFHILKENCSRKLRGLDPLRPKKA